MAIEDRVCLRRGTRPSLATGLALGIAAAVGILSMLMLEGVGVAVRYLPPDALEFSVSNGDVI